MGEDASPLVSEMKKKCGPPVDLPLLSISPDFYNWPPTVQVWTGPFYPDHKIIKLLTVGAIFQLNSMQTFI